MDNETTISRDIWRLAMVGYLAATKPADRPDSKQDEMFAAFVRGNPQHQSWRYLKQFIDQEAGLTGTISFAKVMHQLRDSRIASRVQKLSLEEMAAETNRAVNAKREAADAYMHFLNLLGGSDGKREEGDAGSSPAEVSECAGVPEPNGAGENQGVPESEGDRRQAGRSRAVSNRRGRKVGG